MRVHFRLAVAVALMVLGASARAGNVDPSTVVYKDWGGNPPRTQTIIGGSVAPGLDLRFSKYGGQGIWRGRDRRRMQEMESWITDLHLRNGFELGGGRTEVGVREVYIGTPEKFHPVHLQAQLMRPIAEERYTEIGPGGKRMLFFVVCWGVQVCAEVLTVSFDDISDNDLRRIAFEEGVLRAVEYRLD